MAIQADELRRALERREQLDREVAELVPMEIRHQIQDVLSKVLELDPNYATERTGRTVMYDTVLDLLCACGRANIEQRQKKEEEEERGPA